MTSFYPSAASIPASGTPSYVSPANEAAAFLSSSRVRTGATDFRILPEAKRPRSSASHSRPAPSSAARCLPPMTGPRPAATSSSAQDWVNAALPPTPALQTCTYDPASAQVQASAAYVSYRKHDAPLAPALDSRFAHCPTPELTPPEDAMAVDGPAAAAAVSSSSRSCQPAPSSSTFIKRDDMTAKAIARAASMSMPAQPTLPHKQYSLGSESSSSTSAQPSEKDRLVNSLVGASILAIESIWGQTVSSPDCSMAVKAGGDRVIPLQSFVKEVLRRSRTSCSTLQLALYYLHKSRRGIREAVSRAEASKGDIVRLEQELAECKRRAALAAAQVQTYPEDSYPSPPQSPNEHQRSGADARAHAVHASAVAAELGERFSALVAAQNSPVLCGRRMFLAALISASKYLQDRNYSNRAWAKISGLPVGEINTNERAFLKVVDFQLHLPLEEFQRWTDRLAALASPVAPPVESARPSPLGSSQYGLARSASTYATVSTDQSQLAAGVRANGPLTASARHALSRGQSAAAVLGSSVTPTREKGFPIATARAAAAPLMEYRELASPAAMSTASFSSTTSSGSSESGAGAAEAATAPKRQLRSLPVRRAGTSQRTSTPRGALVPKPAQAAIYVPTSWSSGGSTPLSTASLGGPAGLREFGLEGLDIDSVRVH